MDGGESRGARVSVSNRDSKESDCHAYLRPLIARAQTGTGRRWRIWFHGGSDGFCREEDAADFSGGADEVSGADDDAGGKLDRGIDFERA